MRRWRRAKAGEGLQQIHENFIDELLQSQALYQLFPSTYIGLLLLLFNERVGRTLSYCRYPCTSCLLIHLLLSKPYHDFCY